MRTNGPCPASAASHIARTSSSARTRSRALSVGCDPSHAAHDRGPKIIRASSVPIHDLPDNGQRSVRHHGAPSPGAILDDIPGFDPIQQTDDFAAPDVGNRPIANLGIDQSLQSGALLIGSPQTSTVALEVVVSDDAKGAL